MLAIERTQQRINEQIRISPIRVVAADGALLGILNTDEALAKAREADLDLVEVAPNERPPVCRIMDYGKFKYQQKKKQNRTHTHQSKLKEIRVRPKTGEHDIQVKVTQARAVLDAQGQGDRVGHLPRPRAGPHRRRAQGHRFRHPAIARGRQSRGVAVAAGQTDRLHPGSQVSRDGRIVLFARTAQTPGPARRAMARIAPSRLAAIVPLAIGLRPAVALAGRIFRGQVPFQRRPKPL